MKNPNRRTAIKTLGALGASLVAVPESWARLAELNAPLKLGVIADLHGGLAADASDRLDAFLQAMKTEKCDALVQLGDFAYPNAKHQAYADTLNAAHQQTLHVIGNHEFDYGLKREDCYQAWGIENSYYGRDVGEIRILVLDGNDTGSPTHGGGYPAYIGEKQRQWLESELERTTKPVLILSHQPLAGGSAVDNASEMQELLGRFRAKILLCLNGHSHIDSLLVEQGVAYLHINSASYFWVGGKTRMAYYADPLFTTVTLDPETATINVASTSSRWKAQSPKELGYFDRKGRPPEAVVTPRIRPHHVSRSELNVMTWNIWGRLNQDPRYSIDGETSRQRTIEIIRQSGADVVAMIETYGSAADIAAELGFHHHTTAEDANLCILSRYPLTDVELLKGLNPFSFLAATVNMPGGQPVRVYDIWLTSGGRHIVEIKNDSVSDEEFARGDDNRDEHLQQLLEHPVFQRDLQAADTVPLIVAGDFNCVSHLDYTEATRAAGLNHSRVLPIKASASMQSLGFVDTYRAAHPKIAADSLGHTWTTVGKDYVYESGQGFVPVTEHPRPEYQDPYTRIDYIYAMGEALEVVDSQVLTRHPAYPQRRFPAFPSDHAAVVTRFRIGGNGG